MILKDNLPEHIAIIMDGNRRWAKQRSLPVISGHKAGEKAFHNIVESCCKLGIKTLTAYAFSVENWKRAAEEVSLLMGLFEFYMKEERKYLIKEKIKFKIIGDKTGLPPKLTREFEITEKVTENFERMTLCLAVNYGSRYEIAYAVRRIAEAVMAGKFELNDISPDVIGRYLMTEGIKDPDLIIRTSGEERLSNFLLWQSAYAEFYFTDVLWPDFDEKCLLKAIESYQSRNRRFGGGI